MNLREENEMLRKQIAEYEAERMLAPFVAELSESIMTVLGNAAYEDWPHHAKAAFEHLARKMPVAAAMYKDRLPSE